MKKLMAICFAVACALCTLTGCSDDVFTEKSYSSDGIEKVTVQVEDRELNIGASEDDCVYIDYFDGEKEYLDITLSEKQLTIKLVYDKEWTDYFGVKPSAEYRKIEIRIPNGLLTEFTASTTNESINIASADITESLTLSSNGGSVLCERVYAGKAINLTAKNGNITGSVIGGWDDYSISCTVKKGESNLPEKKESGEKSFTADCNNGNVNIEFIK